MPTESDKRDNREAAFRRANGKGIRCRGKYARRGGSLIEKATGKPTGTLVKLPDTLTDSTGTYRRMSEAERKENKGFTHVCDATGKRIGYGRTRHTLSLVQLVRQKPDYHQQRNVRNNDTIDVIPAGYRQPGEPTDADILRKFSRYCDRRGIEWYPASNDDADDGTGWYCISGDYLTLTLAFPTPAGLELDTDKQREEMRKKCEREHIDINAVSMPWFIRRMEQPLDGREPQAMGSGPITPTTKKRIRERIRESIVKWEDITVHKETYKNPETERIYGILREHFGFTDAELERGNDGSHCWAFEAFLRGIRGDKLTQKRVQIALTERMPEYLIADRQLIELTSRDYAKGKRSTELGTILQPGYDPYMESIEYPSIDTEQFTGWKEWKECRDYLYSEYVPFFLGISDLPTNPPIEYHNSERNMQITESAKNEAIQSEIIRSHHALLPAPVPGRDYTIPADVSPAISPSPETASQQLNRLRRSIRK